MKRILALATCHNRRAKTLRALRSLIRQKIPAAYKLEVCLVDDGSTDGTTEAVRHAFSEVVILQGSGGLFWAGGMRFAWETYARHENFDYLLVFNDDIALYDGALSRLLDTANELEGHGHWAFAVSGALRESSSESIAYGGVIRSSRWHPLRFAKLPPTEQIQECHTLNMNFALISSGAIARVGFLSSEFAHGKADYDFGLRLRGSGGRVVLAPGYLGECDTNPISARSAAVNLAFTERWRRLTSIKEQSPRERAIYFRRHAGFLWPMWWAAPYVRVLAQFLVRDLIRRVWVKDQHGHASSKRPKTP
jgi:GT2 family glycosyltransferase